MYKRQVYVSDEEEKLLHEAAAEGIEVFIQAVPSDTKKILVVFPTGRTAESFLFRKNIYETYENLRKQLECAWKFVII